MELAEMSYNLTIEEATKGVQISTLVRELGQRNMVKCLLVLFSGVCEYLDVDFSSGRMIDLSTLTLKDFWGYKIEDFVLCAANGKRGHYGKSYHRFNGEIWFHWLSQYGISRDEYHMSLATKDKERPDYSNRSMTAKSMSDHLKNDPGYQKALIDHHNKIAKNKLKKK